MMIFCKECGSKLEDNTIFCPNCGTNVTLDDTAAPEDYKKYSDSENNTGTADRLIVTAISPKTKVIEKELKHKNQPKNQNLKSVIKRTILVFSIVLLFFVILFIIIMYAPTSNNDNQENTTYATINSDTTGEAYFKVCLMDLNTYNALLELGNNYGPSEEQFQDFINIPWSGQNVTIYDLSKYEASYYSSLQTDPIYGQYTKTINILEAIAFGSSTFEAMNTHYKLVGLYVNGEPANVTTYLNDGDKVQAVIVFY